MHEFMVNFRQLILFNTIVNHTKENSEGLTHDDIIAIDPNIPRTRISRVMSKLTNDGFLAEKEIKTDMGRPKKHFTLTPKGEAHHQVLKENLLSLNEKLQSRITRDLSEIDFKKITGKTFDHISLIMKNSEDSTEEKREKLLEIKEDLEIKLNQVKSALNTLGN